MKTKIKLNSKGKTLVCEIMKLKSLDFYGVGLDGMDLIVDGVGASIEETQQEDYKGPTAGTMVRTLTNEQHKRIKNCIIKSNK